MRHPENFTHEGIQYDLAHLQPSIVTITLAAHNKKPELQLLLDVKFSNHCYSEGTPKTTGEPHHFCDHNNRPRWFCPLRHQMPYELPKIIEEIHTKKCLFTGKHNWLVVESRNASGTIINYHVYFTLKQHRENKNSFIY